MIDEITRLMRLLEFSDSAFPVGTFSFSNGLETAAFEGIVYDAQTLEQYTRTALRQTIYSDAIAALIAFRAAAGGNYKTILEADRQIILCKMNAEARLMLIRMGKKMAEICTQITDSPWMSRWLEDIRAERTPGTYPVAQAIYFQQNGSTEKDLFVAIEYGAINMILNAALRCVKVSHYETQAILYRLCTEAAENYKIVRELNFEDMQAFAPEMDVIALIEAITPYFLKLGLQVLIITNDIVTTEDAKHVRKMLKGYLAEERIIGVETGACPHTAVREDPSMNIAAVEEMETKFPDSDVVLIESGGDNLTLTFSPALVDFFIYVIDVAAGDKIPRKDGPGISYSDILVINKTDLAPYVHADLEVMRRDSELMRPGKPFVFTNCMTGEGIKELVTLIRDMALFDRVSEKEVEEMKV